MDRIPLSKIPHDDVTVTYTGRRSADVLRCRLFSYRIDSKSGITKSLKSALKLPDAPKL